MRKLIILASVILLILCVAALLARPLARGAEEEAIEPTERISLFDGKSFDGLVRHIRGEGDVDETWTVQPDGVLACSGKPAGYIRTEQPYKNYKLHLEYRWPGRTGNNGILVHMVGEDRVWPKSLECQGMYRNQGDYFEIGGVARCHRDGIAGRVSPLGAPQSSICGAYRYAKHQQTTESLFHDSLLSLQGTHLTASPAADPTGEQKKRARPQASLSSQRTTCPTENMPPPRPVHLA